MMPSDGYIVCCDALDVNDIKKVGTPARSIHFEPELSNTAPKPTAEYQILTFPKHFPMTNCCNLQPPDNRYC